MFIREWFFRYPDADAGAATPVASAAPAASPGSAEDGAPAVADAAGATPTEAPSATGLPDAGNILATDNSTTAAEPKAEGEAATEEAKADLKPEDYTLPETLTAEGFTHTDPMVGAYLTKAAELGLPNEQVSALLEAVAPQVREQLMRPYQAFADLQKTWQDKIKSNPEYGGAKLSAAVEQIRKGVQSIFATPDAKPDEVAARMAEFDDALKVTGAGNSPVLFEVLHKAFGRLAEGNHVVGNAPPGGRKPTAAETIYTHPTSRGGSRSGEM